MKFYKPDIARLLGISRGTVGHKMKRRGLAPSDGTRGYDAKDVQAMLIIRAMEQQLSAEVVDACAPAVKKFCRKQNWRNFRSHWIVVTKDSPQFDVVPETEAEKLPATAAHALPLAPLLHQFYDYVDGEPMGTAREVDRPEVLEKAISRKRTASSKNIRAITP